MKFRQQDAGGVIDTQLSKTNGKPCKVCVRTKCGNPVIIKGLCSKKSVFFCSFLKERELVTQ
jgi:hypothetical protein